MKTFKILLQHDNGKVIIKTKAQTEQQAKEIVMKAEGCPPGAILRVTEIKNPDQ
jgi:hypothetical protein